jgi:hypothetical protein
LSQLANARDPHSAYREKVQAYAHEERKVWEDLRHGFILGSDAFAAKLKAQYLPRAVHKEVPEQKRMLRATLNEGALLKAAAFMEFSPDIGPLRGKVGKEVVESRDLLIYLAWRGGGQTNEAIGRRFGLTYSNVSRRVGRIKARLEKEADLRDRLDQLIQVVKGSENPL